MVILTVYQTVVNLFTFAELVILKTIIIYYETSAVQIQLIEVTETYPRDDGSTVRVPFEEWMPIDILPDVKIKTVKKI